MRIAILGASSQIARDLIHRFTSAGRNGLLLYVRDLDATHHWLEQQGLEGLCSIHRYESYGDMPHEVVINFVGVGDPARAAKIGAAILEITSYFDNLVMKDLSRNPSRRYLYLSSGAVYGNAFDKPVTAASQAVIPINEIRPENYYATAKLTSELLHRSRPDLSIIDLRVFNIFSRTQDIESRFFITDIIRALRDKHTLQTSPDYIVRDFLHPDDFYQLVECILSSSPVNCAVDCYSREPVDKLSILRMMNKNFGLSYEVIGNSTATVNATGSKTHYYSLNKKASEFGYQPTWTSLEGIMTEAAAILCMASNYHNTIR